MKALIVIVIGIAISWLNIDLTAESTWRSLVAPAGLFLFLISLMVWLVLRMHKKGINQHISRSDVGGFDGFGDGGGDC